MQDAGFTFSCSCFYGDKNSCSCSHHGAIRNFVGKSGFVGNVPPWRSAFGPHSCGQQKNWYASLTFSYLIHVLAERMDRPETERHGGRSLQNPVSENEQALRKQQTKTDAKSGDRYHIFNEAVSRLVTELWKMCTSPRFSLTGSLFHLRPEGPFVLAK